MELKTKIELKAKNAIDINIFNSLSLEGIKDKVSQILSHIGKSNIFDEYTKHDITHINSMLELVETVVNETTFNQLTDTEALMITLSIYFHDLGMLVTKDEFNKRNNNTSFVLFKKDFYEHNMGIVNTIDNDKDRYIYQEYVRANHAKRIKDWINEEEESFKHFEPVIVDIIKGMLSDIHPRFKADLANICESHNLDDLIDTNKYKPKQQYSQDPKTIVNLHYCAIVLRVCDLLNITNDRAPTLEMKLISPENAISKLEWLKHNPINVIRPKEKINKEGNIDQTLQPDTFEILAYFNDEQGFFHLMSYLDYARNELIECKKQCEDINTEFSLSYNFPWHGIDDSNIETLGFDREQLLFTIDQTKILDLLIGHTLYNDSSVVMRELLQNSIDACSLNQFSMPENTPYEGNISVTVDNDNSSITVTDNGVGMTIDIIKKHLLKVGSSRYQDPDFKKEFEGFNSISRFGIGLLTCFMISDDIDIITKTKGSDNGLLIKIRKVHGKYLLKTVKKSELPNEIEESGTSITLKPRVDARDSCNSLLDSLKKWIIVPKYPITFIKGNIEKTIGHTTPKEYLESTLNESGIEINEDIQVREEFTDGVNLAYVVKYNKYFKQWEFYQQDNHILFDISGTCIEGIRIDSSTPGFNSQSILALANCTGNSAPKTNVARTNIENNKYKNKFLSNVYNLYSRHIEQEMSNLSSTFSISWASREVSFMLTNILLGNRHINRREFSVSDINLFNNELFKLNVILKEDHETRTLISLNELIKIGEFWTIDSVSFRSADSLIQDASQHKKNNSSLYIMNSIHGDQESSKTDHIKQLVCSLKSTNLDYISKNLIEKFSVSEIKTFPDLRRIDLKWTLKKEEQWSILNLRSEFNDESEVYVQKSDDIVLNDESRNNIIRSSGFIFVLSNNPLHDYLKKINFLFSKNTDRELEKIKEYIGKIISESFFVTHKNNQTVEDLISRVIGSNNRNKMQEDMFYNKINKDEFITSLIKTNFINLDINTWRRIHQL